MALNEVTDLPNDENLEDAALSKLDAGEMLVLKPEAPLQHEVQDHSEEDSEGEEDYEVEWETESLYEDALDGIGEGGLEDATDKCTPEEAKQYRERLRAIGVHKFVQETISAGVITAKKLCTAFGIKPPAFLEGSPDGAYYQLLGLGIKRELEKRIKLPDYNTIDDAVELLKNSKNIVVLTGAGISTSLGIPDFRSKDIGLYAKLAGLGLNDPQEVFDIELFRQDPSIFFSVAKDILPATMKFTPTHAFIRLLQDKDKLLTNFTQNIDNIEGHAGILPEKTIHCHGSFATATCQRCGKSVPGEAIFEDIRNDTIPRCKKCPTPPPNGTGMKRKRSSNGRPKKRQDYEDSTDDDEEDDIAEAGIMKVCVYRALFPRPCN
jgi:NAD-dependent histone deacetylase SIR2